VVQFLRDVRSELRKVTFPSRKETLASTAVVIVVVFLMATYLGVIDLLLSAVITRALR
jgi:preprotein translocase subunit SecE